MPRCPVVGLLLAISLQPAAAAPTIITNTIADPGTGCDECDWYVEAIKTEQTITMTITPDAAAFASSSTVKTGVEIAISTIAGTPTSYTKCTLKNTAGTTVTAACTIVYPSDFVVSGNVANKLAAATAGTYMNGIEQAVKASSGTTYLATMTAQSDITVTKVTPKTNQYQCTKGGCVFSKYGPEGLYWKEVSQAPLATKSACLRTCMKDSKCTGAEVMQDLVCTLWYYRACEVGREPLFFEAAGPAETCSKTSTYRPNVSHAADHNLPAMFLTVVMLLFSTSAMWSSTR